MRHWIYDMHSGVPDPANSGDLKTWFFYYRWEKNEEVYLPVTAVEMGIYEHQNVMPQVGDDLWLVVDYELLGLADIIRVYDDPMMGRWELWYNAGAVQVVPTEKRKLDVSKYHFDFGTRLQQAPHHDDWKELLGVT